MADNYEELFDEAVKIGTHRPFPTTLDTHSPMLSWRDGTYTA
jgi:hypothetical protein